MDAPIGKLVSSSLHQFQKLTQKPELFLGVQKTVAVNFQETTKKVYDLVKVSEENKNDALPELIVENFDDEQIWQELELQNGAIISSLLEDVSHVLAGKESVSFRLRGATKVSDGKESKKNVKTTKDKLKFVKKSRLKDRQHRDGHSEEAESGDEDDELVEAESGQISQTENADDNVSDESDTDTEINKIKSRLKSSGQLDTIHDDDSDLDGLDFDFGELGGDDSDEDNDKDEDNMDKDIADEADDRNRTKSGKTRTGNKTEQPSVVDDKFFKLSQMEVFLEQEDKKEEEKRRKERKGDSESDSEDEDEDEVDMFDELPSSEDEDLKARPSKKMKYKDFFPPVEGAAQDGDEDEEDRSDDSDKSNEEDDNDDDDDDDDRALKKKVRFSETETRGSDNSRDGEGVESAKKSEKTNTKHLLSDSDSEGEDIADILGGKKEEEKSNFEKRQERLSKRITEMEDASLAEKPWQLAGEITSVQRPENSLIEEFLQFDQTTKLPPVVTEETTKDIEDIIRQRMKDQAWDDVERKVKPKEDPFEYKKRVVLDQEKSKLSLGEIYEQEYLKQQKKEEEEEIDPDHEDIKKEMRDLFIKLDALSNFHFTPKPPAPDIKIVSNLPSINMEEVAPVSASDAKLLAPQEIKEKTKGEVKSQTEKTDTDRKRERREKKAAKRAREKAKEQRQKLVDKLHPGLGNKYSKEKALKELEKSSKQDKGIKIIKDDKKGRKSSISSKTFFTQLQEEVVSQISKKRVEKSSKAKNSEKSSKKFKL